MKRLLFLVTAIILNSSCKNNQEREGEALIRHLQGEDTMATQFNPAHREEEDTSLSTCRNVEIEMGAGEECEIKSTTIEKEYENLVSENLVQGFKLLPATLPVQDKVVQINQEGLISSEFKWTGKQKLAVILYYDGGQTEVDFQQKGNNILRAIYYSAD